MIPPKTIISIIGFENMATRLNDSGGTKYKCLCLGMSVIGCDKSTVEAGFNGVPTTYGRTSGSLPESKTSTRSYPR
jgi:hypothetical protein